MKKIFLVFCLGMIWFSRISSAARKTVEDRDVKFPTEMKFEYVRVYKKK